MLLVIDVGNTNMEFGVYRGEELVGSFRLMTDANRTSDELGLWLCQYFQRFGLELGQVEDVVIGSVAPQVMHTLSRAVQKYVGKTPLVLDEALDPGLPYVECDSDERLGPDRAAADIAAIAKYGAPLGGAGLRHRHHPGRGKPGGRIPGRLHHRRGAGVHRRAVPEDCPAAPGGAGEAGHSAEHHRRGADPGGGGAGLYRGHRVPHPPRQGGDRPAGSPRWWPRAACPGWWRTTQS